MNWPQVNLKSSLVAASLIAGVFASTIAILSLLSASDGGEFANLEVTRISGADGPSVQEIWERPRELISWNSTDLDSIAVSTGVVLVSTQDNELYGIDITSGKQLWQREIDCFPSSPLSATSQVGIVHCGPYVTGYNALTGETIWKSERNWLSHVTALNDVVYGTGIYFSTTKINGVAALSGDDGRLLWWTEIPGLTEFRVHTDVVLAISGNRILSIEPKTGSIRGTTVIDDTNEINDLALSGSRMAVISDSTVLSILEDWTPSFDGMWEPEPNRHDLSHLDLAKRPIAINELLKDAVILEVVSSNLRPMILSFDLGEKRAAWTHNAIGAWECVTDVICLWKSPGDSLEGVRNANGNLVWAIEVASGNGRVAEISRGRFVFATARKLYVIEFSK